MESSGNNIIIELQYFPCVHAMKAMVDSDSVCIEQWEHYCKMSFRNRSIIVGSNGLIHLSVPLKDGRQQRNRITDVKIDNTVNWQAQHWRSITSCYARAPFFDYFEMKFQQFYQQPYEYLFDFNMAILKTLLSVFKSSATLNLSESFNPNVADLTDMRNVYLPKNYNTNINNSISYTQVFEDKNGFVPNLSVIDYICCEGVRLS